MSTHSKIGASSAHRWWNCPGSVALIESLGPLPETSSPFAIEGTAAHMIAEDCLRNRHDAEIYRGQTLAYEDTEVTDEMTDAVNLYVKTIVEDMASDGVDYSELSVERKFHLVDVDPHAYGTNDASYGVDFGVLRIYDLKYGKGVTVEVENNKQFMYYAAGALEDGFYDEVEMVVVQPRAPHKDGPVRRWRVPASTILDFKKELKKRIAETRKPGAKLCDGDWCKFCDAKAICPKLHNLTMDLAVNEFSAKTTPVFPQPHELTMKQLTTIMEHADRIKDYISSVFVQAFKLAESGKPIPGYKLVQRRSNRAWRDPKEVEAEFALEVDDKKLYKRTLLSPAQLEKVVGKERVAALCHNPDKGSELVPESDKREAIGPSALEDFDVVEQEEDDLFE